MLRRIRDAVREVLASLTETRRRRVESGRFYDAYTHTWRTDDPRGTPTTKPDRNEPRAG